MIGNCWRCTTRLNASDMPSKVENSRSQLYHKPLIYASKQNPGKCSPREFRHLDYVGQFTTDIRHIKGVENNVADTLSRIEAIGKPVDHHKLAAAQGKLHSELREIINTGSSALHLKKVRFPDHDVELYCGITAETVRPYVPEPLRRIVFQSLHGISHPGMRATRKLASSGRP